MQNALAPKSPEDVNNETAGDIQGGHFFSEKWKILDSYVLLIAEKVQGYTQTELPVGLCGHPGECKEKYCYS